MIPEFIKKPTGVAFIDDINMMLIAQKGSLTSGAILTGLVMFITGYVESEFLLYTFLTHKFAREGVFHHANIIFVCVSHEV